VANCVRLDSPVAEVYEVKRLTSSRANERVLAEKLI